MTVSTGSGGNGSRNLSHLCRKSSAARLDTFHIALSCLAGCWLLTLMPDLRAHHWGVLLLAAIAVMLASMYYAVTPLRRPILLISLVLCAFCYSAYRATAELDQRLDDTLAGVDISMILKIDSIPRAGILATRFDADVLRVLAPADIDLEDFPQKLSLSWYQGKGSPETLRAGQVWRLTARLKPPHGFANPAGFDMERWLFTRGIHATGYVRNNEAAVLIRSGRFDVDAMRQSINTFISSVIPDEREGLVQALATGSRHGISRTAWDTLIASGTNHLVAISGLHIGLAAGLGWLLSRQLGRWLIPEAVLLKLPLQDISVLSGFVLALLYSLLSGMAVPAQRALIMLTCYGLIRTLRRHMPAKSVLATAMILVLVWQPSTVLLAGFWYSFIAVGLIIWMLQSDMKKLPTWQQFVLVQIVLSLSMMPLSLLLFQQASVVSIVANLLMVPVVSFLVVPAVLLAIVSVPLSWSIAQLLLMFADSVLAACWPFMEVLTSWQYAVFETRLSAWQLSAIVMLCWALYARYQWLVTLALTITAVSLVPTGDDHGDHGSYTVDVLDVGQGSAILIRTARHAVLYDTGARFGSSDTGRSVIIPVLRESGIGRIDHLIISHADNDHIGGAASVIEAMEVGTLIGQTGVHGLPGSEKCYAGQSWHYDGVSFEILHPPDDSAMRSRNDSSCVLRVTSHQGSVLLTGDIELRAEKHLLATQSHALAADILIVPHHGSRTSSAASFVAAVDPLYAVFTAGYRNRYRLPSQDVVERYRKQGSRVLVSGLTGRIRFELAEGLRSPQLYRVESARFWHHKTARM